MVKVLFRDLRDYDLYPLTPFSKVERGMRRADYQFYVKFSELTDLQILHIGTLLLQKRHCP